MLKQLLILTLTFHLTNFSFGQLNFKSSYSLGLVIDDTGHDLYSNAKIQGTISALAVGFEFDLDPVWVMDANFSISSNNNRSNKFELNNFSTDEQLAYGLQAWNIHLSVGKKIKLFKQVDAIYYAGVSVGRIFRYRDKLENIRNDFPPEFFLRNLDFDFSKDFLGAVSKIEINAYYSKKTIIFASLQANFKRIPSALQSQEIFINYLSQGNYISTSFLLGMGVKYQI